MDVADSKQHDVRAVAVVGGSRYLGAHLVGALLREPSIDKVLAIDSIKPSAQFRRRMSGAEFVRIDIQSPRLQGILREHEIDTVVHAGLDHNDFTPGGRAAIKESNIMGSMHVIAAAGRASGVKRFVLLSSTSVYGSSGVDPSLFSEVMAARRSPGGGIPRDYLSVEGYVRGMNRKRPDIEVTILRMPAILGLPEPTVFGELLQPTVTPVLAGFDPRVQLLHPQDALEALVLAAKRGPAGTFNIAADGVVTLSQAIRRAGHIPIPVLAPFFRVAAGVLTGEGLRNIGPSQMQYLRYGRGLDNRRMREEFHFEPKYTTDEALDAYFVDSNTHPIASYAATKRALEAFVSAMPRRARPAMRWAVDRVLAQMQAPVAALPVAPARELGHQIGEWVGPYGRKATGDGQEPHEEQGVSSVSAHAGARAPASTAARRSGSKVASGSAASAAGSARESCAPVTERALAKQKAHKTAKKATEQKRAELKAAAKERAAKDRASAESAATERAERTAEARSAGKES